MPFILLRKPWGYRFQGAFGNGIQRTLEVDHWAGFLLLWEKNIVWFSSPGRHKMSEFSQKSEQSLNFLFYRSKTFFVNQLLRLVSWSRFLLPCLSDLALLAEELRLLVDWMELCEDERLLMPAEDRLLTDRLTGEGDETNSNCSGTKEYQLSYKMKNKNVKLTEKQLTNLCTHYLY